MQIPPARDVWHFATDSRRRHEILGDRVVFRALERAGAFERAAEWRILEIGPKHGEDSRLLAALHPRELVLVDRPDKREMIDKWYPEVSRLCPTRYIEGLAPEAIPHESFDLVWCLGVLYHNREQLRLLRGLYDACAPDALLVLESATTRTRRLQKENVVEIHWPTPYRNIDTITHMPSRGAIRSWLEMVGFADVQLLDVYSRAVRPVRAVFTARRPA